MTTHTLINQLKDAGQDHEFYPTTIEIIASLVRDLKAGEGRWRYHWRDWCSVLDIGAGNGKVLKALRDQDTGLTKLYAIEKSAILCSQLDHDIFIVGTAFEEQSLLSKKVDVIFSNPPYSVFASWSAKIIREANAQVIYLVIPQRWEASEEISAALEFRRADAHIVGAFDFENSEDRAARAKVHLLRITLDRAGRDDSFERFFDEQFAGLKARYEDAKQTAKSEPRAYAGLVVGEDYPTTMVNCYLADMAKVQRNYHLVSELDVDLMREFEITPKRIMEGLKMRLSGLRQEYWHELFNRMKPVTDRLTHKSRKTLLATLQENVHVDFTVSNIHAVIIWVLKNANRFIESQLIEVYSLMVDKANVILYKSNQRTFEQNRWRYMAEDNSHYSLDYRIVSHRVGGITGGGWRNSYGNGLEQSANEFLGDMLTLANNLGFSCETNHPSLLSGGGVWWEAGKPKSFCYKKPNGAHDVLMTAKAFGNGNVHLKLNKKFMLALNVEFGRLKGWLRSGDDAAAELGEPEAAQFFKSNLQLMGGEKFLLLA